jgi:hypothetical protein
MMPATQKEVKRVVITLTSNQKFSQTIELLHEVERLVVLFGRDSLADAPWGEVSVKLKTSDETPEMLTKLSLGIPPSESGVSRTQVAVLSF